MYSKTLIAARKAGFPQAVELGTDFIKKIANILTFEDYSKIEIRMHPEFINKYTCEKLAHDYQRFGKPE